MQRRTPASSCATICPRGATDVYQLAHPQAPALPVATNNHAITISGARHHNLKNIEVHIPRDQLVVITGLERFWEIDPGL